MELSTIVSLVRKVRLSTPAMQYTIMLQLLVI